MADTKQLDIILSGKKEGTAFKQLAKEVSKLSSSLKGLDDSANENTEALNATDVGMKQLTTAFFTGNIAATVAIEVFKAVAGTIIAVGGAAMSTAYELGMVTSSVNEAKTALDVVAQRHGLNVEEVEKHRRGLESLNLTAKATTDFMTTLIKANIDYTKSSELARTAQDLAVVSQSSSSDAIATITHALMTGNTQVLAQIGITKNLSDMYAEFAASSKKVATQLTETEKKQAIVNAILKEGEGVIGLYEKSLGTASKSIRSLNDRITMIKESLGNLFAPLLDVVIPMLNKITSGFVLFLRENEDLIRGLGTAIREWLIAPFSKLITTLTDLFTPMRELQKAVQAGTDTLEMHEQAVTQVGENLKGLEGPINFIGNAIIAVGASFKIQWAVIKQGGSILKLIGQSMYGVGEIIAGLGSIVVQLISKFMGLSDVGRAVTTTLGSMFGGLGSMVLKTFGIISNEFGKMSDELNNKMDALDEKHRRYVDGVEKGIDTTLFEKGVTRIEKASFDYMQDVMGTGKTMVEGTKLLFSALSGNAFDVRKMLAGITPVARETITGIEAMTGEATEMSYQMQKAIADIGKKMVTETKNYTKQTESRRKAFDKSLEAILWRHKDNKERIEELMAESNVKYSDSLKEREDEYHKHVATIKRESEEKRAKIIGDFDEETRSLRENLLRQLSSSREGDQTLIAKAREELLRKRAEREKNLIEIGEAEKLDKLKEAHEDDLTELASNHDEKMSELKEEYDIELELYQKYASEFATIKHKTRLDDIAQAKADFALEIYEMRVQHDERMAELRKQEQEARGTASISATAEGSFGGVAQGKYAELLEYFNKGKTTAQYFAETGQQSLFNRLKSEGTDPTTYLKNHPSAQEGMVLRGTGPQPITAHGGETILTPEQTKGLLVLLNNIGKVGMEAKTQGGVVVNNTITAQLSNDYSVDRLVQRLSNAYRQEGRR